MNTKTHTQTFGIAALSVDLTNTDTGGQVQLTPDGTFKARDGRPAELPGFQLSDEIAAALLTRLHDRANDIVVDYEHQTLYSEKNGKPAPAAGWIDPLSIIYIPGVGLKAKVKWTPTAAQLISNDEYRYLSPVLSYDRKTGAVLDLLNVALTNFPALDGMDKVAAAALRARLDSYTPLTTPLKTNTPQEDTFVEREELIRLLGLSSDATDEQIQTALTAAQTSNASLAALRAELALKDDDDAVIAVAALKSKTQPDLSQFAPLSIVEALKGEIAQLRQGQATSEAGGIIKDALASGKLLPAQKQWAEELANTNLAALKTYLAQTPAIAALRTTQTDGKQPADAETSKPSQAPEALAVLKQLGVTEDDAAKVTEQENS